MTPEVIIVGRLGRAHGVRGEIAVIPLTDFPERFQAGAELLVGPAPGEQFGETGLPPTEALMLLEVATSRQANDRYLLRFEGIDDRDAAEALTGAFAYIPTADAEPLGEDEYYPHELIGLAARTAAGEPVGRVADLIETGEVGVLVIRRPGAPDAMVPLAADFIEAIDLAAGALVIKPVPGLLD